MHTNTFLYLFFYLCIFSSNNLHAQVIDCGFEKINSDKKYDVFQWADSKSFFMVYQPIIVQNYMMPAGSEINSDKYFFVALDKEYAGTLDVKNGDFVHLTNPKNKKNAIGFVFILEELQDKGDLLQEDKNAFFYKIRVSNLISKSLDASTTSSIILFFFPNSNRNLDPQFLANVSNIENSCKKLMQKADAYRFLEKCLLPRIKNLFHQKEEENDNNSIELETLQD